MALPPSIPTSFVPKQPVTAAPRHRVSGSNPFLALAYIITGITILGCFAVFGYEYYLQGVAKTKANEVVAAQNQIDQATVTDFVRLRDRFTQAKGLLNSHITFSQFLDVLEARTLVGVRFTALKATVTDDRTARIEMNGVARSFNTLAAQSASFATEKRIKRAIFSGITLNGKDNSVVFSLSADLDPSLVTASPTAAGTETQTPVQKLPDAPVATTTPKSATTTQKAATTTP